MFDCTTNGKFTDAPLARPLAVNVMRPVPPIAGVMHVHPGGGVIDWKLQLAGTEVVNVTLSAKFGPLFVSVCVYVMLLPAVTGSGLSTFVTARSAIAHEYEESAPAMTLS